MDKVDKKIKTYGIILGVILFVLLIAGFTYANLAWNSKSIVISGKSNCLEVESVKGSNITGGNLLLQDESLILNNNQITIKNGMIVTNVTAKIKSTCSISGYMTLNLNVTNLSNAFTSSGNSTGALKYVIASYDPSTYSTVSTTTLNGKSFNIVNTGSITSTGTIKLKEENLSKTQTKAYLVIFYIDGDMANNDAGSNSTNFKSNLEAIVTQEEAPKESAATFIINLYNTATKTTTTVNSVTYNLASSVGLMNDRKGSMSTGIDAGNIRYYGANPNNYIYFNCSDYSNQSSSTCELWRIIGVFDGKVKLIRNENIGSITYDNDDEDTYLQSIARDNDGNNSRVELLKYNISDEETIIKLAPEIPLYAGQNDYSKSSLQKILNNYYYNSLKYTGKYTYDFTSTGFKNDTTRNMIAEITYNLGGHDSALIYSNQIYSYERGTTVYSGNATTWTGKIAVAYPSDYGYAADLSLCQEQLGSYYEATCTANNWMKNIVTNNGANYGWLLTPDSGAANFAWYVESTGRVHYYLNASLAHGVAPVLSLTSKLGIGPGSGTSSSPYQLSV